MEEQNKKEDSTNRRGFVGKTIALAAASGIASMLIGGRVEKAQAADATYDNLVVDISNANNGAITPGIQFGTGGPNSGEGISSKRTATGNQYGLDFYTYFTKRMSITQGGNVGIGTDNPQALLHVSGSGASPNILMGDAGNTITSTVVGATISGGGYSVAPNFWQNRVTDNFGTVSGGLDNQAGDDTGTTSDREYATVGGGDANTASGKESTVGGGGGNRASGWASTVGGGLNNQASVNYSTVSGGQLNMASGVESVVGGGNGNEASGYLSTVGGGAANQASGGTSTVGGGNVNRATNDYATVGGGWSNQASGRLSTVGGGETNEASGQDSAVVGGYGNQAAGDWSAVGGGYQNQASVSYSTVCGGYMNAASESYSTVSGGHGNQASSSYSTVSGGGANYASGTASTVSGGVNNTASALRSTVPGGADNAAAGNYSFAAGRKSKVGAEHAGTFLYADSNDYDFNSAAVNEFAVRCTGGARFVTAIDGSGNPSKVVVITPGGKVGIGTSYPSFDVHVLGVTDPASVTVDAVGIVAPNFMFRRARGTVGTPSAVQATDALLYLVAKGYAPSGFTATGRANMSMHAAENWTDTAQGTYMCFRTTQAGTTNQAEKMRITDTGDVLPGTNNTGSIGNEGKRWNLVRATTITPGDLVFENGYRMTEDPDSGMLLMNQKGERIARFDEEGNLHIKGDIIKDL